MSYTKKVKNEIINQKRSGDFAVSFLSGFVRNNYYEKDNELYLSIYSLEFKNIIINMFNNIYHIKIDVIENNSNTNFISKYTCVIKDKVNFIKESLGIIDKSEKYLDSPPEYLVADDELKKEYLKGAFVSSGSINDPKSSKYHLELLINNKYETVFLQSLINSYDLNSKIINRNNRYMIYIKEAEKICDFIKVMGANISVMDYINVIIYHEQKNIANRLNNFEQANVEKTINSANNVINAINKLKENDLLNIFDDTEMIVINYRLKYPEDSLKELVNKINKHENLKLTKSYLNHKFRKIRKLSENM